jgi:hypothetical protein
MPSDAGKSPIPSFGKNQYKFDLTFRFDCVSNETIKNFIFRLKVEAPVTVAKDEKTGHSIVTWGVGTEQSPFFQLRLGLNKISFWAGWYVLYEKWRTWCKEQLTEITPLIDDIPPLFITELLSQATIIVPFQKLEKVRNISAMKPLVEFHRRYLPKEFLSGFGTYNLFIDQSGLNGIEWQYSEDVTAEEASFVFAKRRCEVDQNIKTAVNVRNHFDRFNELFLSFSANVISPTLK